MAFEEESKRKLLNLISVDNFIKNNNAFHFRVEIIIILKWKSFLISKNLIQILWICNCNKNLAIFKRNWIYCLRKTLECYRTIIGNIYRDG